MKEPEREPGRKTPEELLESIHKEARGKLTIYLGSAAGVGKTYSMLEAARERKTNGADVVIGWIETHGRKETERLTEGLERIPPMSLDYMDKMFQELDLDAVIMRKPELVIVDELAHTNIHGARHARRFQDVEELLEAGMNVYTTLNIQHVESLNDLVAQITGIVVSETLPDRIVEKADFIRLIDISTDELINRLKEGKVYVPAQAEQALRKFFRPGNLNALRELAMRFAARRVDREINEYMRAHHIEGPWPVAGNVMVCVTASPSSAQLIRAAFQLATGLRSEWIAVHVEAKRWHIPRGERETARLDRNIRMAEELGAKTFTVVGDDLIREILELARVHNVSALVMGKPRHNRLWDFIYGSVVDELVRRGVGLNIYVIQTGETPDPATVIMTRSAAADRINWKHYAGSLLMVGLVTLFGWYFREELNPINIAFLYLLPVVLSASWWGKWPSFCAALCGVALLDYLFIPPFFTFTVDDFKYLLSFVIFLIVAFAISVKTEQLRTEADSARMREKSSRTLYEFGSRIAGVLDLGTIARELCMQISETLEREAVVLFPGARSELEVSASHNPLSTGGRGERSPSEGMEAGRTETGKTSLDGSAMAVAAWAYKNAKVAGKSTETLSECPYLFLPLLAKGKAEGVLGVNIGDVHLHPEQRRLLETWVRLAAIVIERVKLEETAHEAALLVESERLHTALFNSLSHELKTPLSSIMGSISTLIEAEVIYSPEQKRQLLDEIRSGALRLNRVVVNLLDTARIESGMLELKTDSGDIEDIIGAALRHMKDQLKSAKIEVNIPADLAFIRGDSVLIELVLINLIDNSLKFSRPEGTICISSIDADEKVRISVADEGKGIPESEIGRIFDKFYRGRHDESDAGGSGLGLSICKAIVELHGGTIWAENRAQGGAVIHFTIPKAPDGTGRAVPPEKGENHE
jgi:two-component system, OmpR family, sensor histidine kinase KdpD